MEEHTKNSLEVSIKDACEKAKEMTTGSEEREREFRSIASIAKEVNSQCKIQNERELEMEKIQNDYEIRIKELHLKELELEDAKKKSIAELIVKGGLGLLGGVIVPIFIAVAEPKGLFVRQTSWKMPKI